MTISLVLALFITLFFLPFLPGIIELIRKRDAEPLYIAMNYIKDPRYFSKAFKGLLRQATKDFTSGPGVYDIQLSKKEKLEISDSKNILNGERVDHLLYVRGDLTSFSDTQFVQEMYVTGNTSIGPRNTIHVLASDGNVAVDTDLRLERWLDAAGNVDIGGECNLGISASSGGKLHLGQRCVFRRLYGTPITTTASGDGSRVIPIHYFKPALPPIEITPPEKSFVRMNNRSIRPGTKIGKNVVFTQDVKIGMGSVFRGSVKSYGKLVLQDDVTIDGNLFADDDIVIGSGATISGHVFSQKTIFISAGTVISSPGSIKSVVGKKAVHIEQNVIIYGYVTTEGEGRIV